MRGGKSARSATRGSAPRPRNLDRQLGALRAERCEVIFAEKMSGKSLKGRPQLEKAIDALGAGDLLVVAEWDRATGRWWTALQPSTACWPWLRRFQYAIPNMATQQMALTVKQAANPQSERLMSA
jgi:hypothetical protein